MKLQGIQSLKPKQREAIISYISATDTLVVLPTGYGKSLIIIYAILPLLYNKIRSIYTSKLRNKITRLRFGENKLLIHLYMCSLNSLIS